MHHLIVSRRGDINDEDAHEDLAIDEVIFQTIIYATVIYKFTKNKGAYFRGGLDECFGPNSNF